MSGVRILHFLKDWWKFIQTHQNYTMALSFSQVESKNNVLCYEEVMSLISCNLLIKWLFKDTWVTQNGNYIACVTVHFLEAMKYALISFVHFEICEGHLGQALGICGGGDMPQHPSPPPS